MFLLYLFIPVSLFYFLYTRLNSPLSKIPGPYYTIFTSLYLKLQEFTGNRRLYIDGLHTKYGSVVRIGPNEVSFASLEAMKEIYTSGGSGYDRTEFYELFKQFGTKTLFSMPPRVEHSQRKRILADRYANTNIMRPETIDNLKSRAKLFLDKCLAERNGDADVYVHLHCYALDGASQHLFAPYGTNSLGDAADLEIMKEMSYHDSLKAHYLKYYLPTLSRLLNKLQFRRPRHVPKANTYVQSTVQRPSPASYSLLSKLQSKSSELEPLSAAAECMDHLAAGIDTTGDALCFLMHQLSLPSSHHIQHKLQQELRRNLDSETQGWEKLEYLDAVVKEGLRVFPPIPMSFPRYTPPEGVILDGYPIPGHTIVSCQPYTLHKDPIAFPDPDVFDPERWISADTPEELQHRNRLFFSFSAGARGCIGKHLALAEIKILLARVYVECGTRVSPGMRADMRLDDQVISSRPKGQLCRLVFERI